MEKGRMHPDPERLSRVPILGELSEDERSRLAAWLHVQEFEAGKKLTREGAMFGTRFRELEMSMPEVAERIQELARERTKAVREG
jgi:hypothetical protein